MDSKLLLNDMATVKYQQPNIINRIKFLNFNNNSGLQILFYWIAYASFNEIYFVIDVRMK